jgi:hypothetical protein
VEAATLLVVSVVVLWASLLFAALSLLLPHEAMAPAIMTADIETASSFLKNPFIVKHFSFLSPYPLYTIADLVGRGFFDINRQQKRPAAYS